MNERKLTWDEQIKWGDCPVCGAKNGEYCLAEIGIQLGHRRLKTGEGVHLPRLQAAPVKVTEVPA